MSDIYKPKIKNLKEIITKTVDKIRQHISNDNILPEDIKLFRNWKKFKIASEIKMPPTVLKDMLNEEGYISDGELQEYKQKEEIN